MSPVSETDNSVEQQLLIKERSATVVRSPRGYEVTARWFGKRLALNSFYDWSESGLAFDKQSEARAFAVEAFMLGEIIRASGIKVLRLGDGSYKIGRAGRRWWLHVNVKTRLLAPQIKLPQPPKVEVPENWCLLDVVRAMVVACEELDGRKSNVTI